MKDGRIYDIHELRESQKSRCLKIGLLRKKMPFGTVEDKTDPTFDLYGIKNRTGEISDKDLELIGSLVSSNDAIQIAMVRDAWSEEVYDSYLIYDTVNDTFQYLFRENKNSWVTQIIQN